MQTHIALRAVLQELEKAGGEWRQPPTLLEARLLVELSGEAVRPRLCRFSGPDGEELCLRPDMTVPLVCMSEGSPERICYTGPVWLYPQKKGQSEDIEVPQAGFEWFGGKGGPEEDAQSIALTLQAARAAGAGQAALSLSDMRLWRAVIEALALPESWRTKLAAANHWRDGIRSVLDKAERVPALARRLRSLSPDAARQAVADMLEEAGSGDIGRRRLEDIERRLAGFVASQSIPPDARRLLTELSEISAPFPQAMEQLARLCKEAGLAIEDAIERLTRTWDWLEEQRLPLLDKARFVSVSGGRFDYYDGLMFELIHKALGPEQALARGGRYDGLALRLGRAPLRAVGAALRPDRLARAAMQEAHS